jgi:YVTN family beta-propeller protein
LSRRTYDVTAESSMVRRRFALLIATYDYEDDSLSRLVAPAHDANDLAAVLGDPEIAGFDVTILVNKPHHVVGQAIGEFFRQRRHDDLTLLYFTGHGLKDDDGRLYLAMTNSRHDSLIFTGLSAEQIDYAMEACPSRQKVLILDCCYSGAFPAGRLSKGDPAVHTLERFHGKGRVVLTASDATQYSFEGDDVRGTGVRSLFTRFLVEGIRTGRADLDADGDISLEELYSYVHDRVVEQMPQQRPKKQEDIEGRIVVAHNIQWTLPDYLQNAIASPLAIERRTAVDVLTHLYRRGNAKVRLEVIKAAERLRQDDSKMVSAAMEEFVASLLPTELEHLEAAEQQRRETAERAVERERREAVERERREAVERERREAVERERREAVERERREAVERERREAVERERREAVERERREAVERERREAVERERERREVAEREQREVVERERRDATEALSRPQEPMAEPTDDEIAHLTSVTPSGPGQDVTRAGTREGALRIRSRRQVLITLGAVLLSMVMVVGLVRWQHRDSADSTVDSGFPSPPISATPAPATADPLAIRASIAEPSVVATVPVGKRPKSVTMSPDGKVAYIANLQGGDVSVFDVATRTVTGSIPIEAGPPQFVAFSPDGGRAYVSVYTENNSINGVVVVDTASQSVVTTVPVGKHPFALAVTPDGKEIFVPCHDDGRLYVLSASENKVISQIPVEPNPHFVTFTSDGRSAYVANHESNLISVVDVASRQVSATIPVGRSPHSLALAPDGRKAYVVNYDGGDVSVVDTVAREEIAHIGVGANPQSVAFAPDGRHAYVVNDGANNLSVIESQTEKVTSTVPLGASPTVVAVTPDGQSAVVTNIGDNSLSVLTTGES